MLKEEDKDKIFLGLDFEIKNYAYKMRNEVQKMRTISKELSKKL